MEDRIDLPVSVVEIISRFKNQPKRYSIYDAQDWSIGVSYEDHRIAHRVAELVNAGETNLAVAEQRARELVTA